MVADVSPTVRQRELGLRLRNLRTEQGLTVEDAAEKLMCSTAKISRLETGARRPALRDVRDLCDLYNVDPAVAGELMNLTRQAREQGWWARYDDLNLTPYVGLEQDASTINAYCMYFLHGLVQTEDYARAIIKAIAPRISPDVLQQRVQARLRRQQLLEGDSRPGFRLYLDEAVLWRQVGGPEVMAAQAGKILDLIAEDKVKVQVIPFSAGAYSVTDLSFTLLDFDQPRLSSVVYIEGRVSGHYFERPPDIASYREAVEDIRDSALSPRDSAERLERAKEAYAAGRSSPV